MRSPGSARPFGSIRPTGGARSPDGVRRFGGVSRSVPRSASVDGSAPDRRSECVDAPPAPEALDLRLAPVALAAWAAAGWGCAADVRACLGAGAVALAAAGIALVPALRHRPARHRHDPRPGAQVPGGARGSVAASALVVALACASVLGVTAALLHVRERDPLTVAAAASRRATLIATVDTAPRPVVTARRPAVLVELGVRSVDGAPSHQRAVVLGDSRWLDLPLGATVRVHGPLRAAQPGSAEAAWLGAGASVRVLADPSGSLARVGRLREGLARAAGAEPADVAEPDAGAEPDGGGRAAEPADGDGAPRWPPGARALVPGVALGDDRALPQTVREEMRAVSMTHLTAVSGQHVALVLGLVLTGLGVVPRRVRAGAGLVVLTGLVVLVRPGGSVLRAGVMGAVMLAGVASGRRSVSMPALAGAVLILVLIDPWQSRDYGFALSVAATAGILVGERPARAALSRRLPRWLAASLALPLVAQAACAPVLILLQPQVGLWSVPANVIAAPPVPVATICGLAAALVEPLWPGAAAWAALPAVASCAWLAAVAHVFAALPGARIPWPGGWPGAVGLAVLEAAAALLVSRRARRRLLRAARGPARASLMAAPAAALTAALRALRALRSPAPAPRRPRSPAPRGRLGPWHRPDPPAAAHAPPRRAPPGTRSPSRRSSSSAPGRRSSPTAPSPAWWPWPARGTRRPGSPRSRPPPTSPTGSTPSSRPPCSASPGSSSSPPWSR